MDIPNAGAGADPVASPTAANTAAGAPALPPRQNGVQQASVRLAVMELVEAEKYGPEIVKSKWEELLKVWPQAPESWLQASLSKARDATPGDLIDKILSTTAQQERIKREAEMMERYLTKRVAVEQNWKQEFMKFLDTYSQDKMMQVITANQIEFDKEIEMYQDQIREMEAEGYALAGDRSRIQRALEVSQQQQVDLREHTQRIKAMLDEPKEARDECMRALSECESGKKRCEDNLSRTQDKLERKTQLADNLVDQVVDLTGRLQNSGLGAGSKWVTDYLQFE